MNMNYVVIRFIDELSFDFMHLLSDLNELGNNACFFFLLLLFILWEY